MTRQIYPEPSFSKAKVNWAGKILCDKSVSASYTSKAIEIIDDWRAAHRRPMTHMNIFLRNHAAAINPKFVIAQRLKRTPSIRHKLDRFPSMQLARMQDIGGCRAVLNNIREVRALRDNVLASRAKHILAHSKDYIAEPKESGYRGIHLIYRYHSDTYTKHCGLMVEIQIRSTIQHVWATGVETVGTFIRSPLKSSIGPKDWLEFFARLSTTLHLKESNPRIYKRLEEFHASAIALGKLINRIDAKRRLTDFGNLVKLVEQHKQRETRTFVLHLKPVQGIVQLFPFRTQASPEALKLYSRLEQEANIEQGEDVVLVSTDSIRDLRQAYPNYFLDTRRLVKELDALMEFMG